MLLDHSNVHGRRGAGTVDFLVGHDGKNQAREYRDEKEERLTLDLTDEVESFVVLSIS